MTLIQGGLLPGECVSGGNAEQVGRRQPAKELRCLNKGSAAARGEKAR